MTSTNGPDAAPDSFSDPPLQPTGSGVADLEIAYEEMLTEGERHGRDPRRRPDRRSRRLQ